MGSGHSFASGTFQSCNYNHIIIAVSMILTDGGDKCSLIVGYCWASKIVVKVYSQRKTCVYDLRFVALCFCLATKGCCILWDGCRRP